MRLSGRDVRFELQIVGYQFPGNATSDYDSNWLVVEGVVRHPRGNWGFRDPSLLTYEVARLADWLEAVASGTESQPWCGFIEPNLSFDVGGDGGRVLRVSFACEARPAWAADHEEVSVGFHLATLDLGSAVASLRAQLRNYPQRADK